MRQGLLLIILAVMVAGCDAYTSTYLHVMAAQLPPPGEGRSLHIPTIDVHVDVTTFPLGNTTWDISPWERDAGHLEHLSWIDSVGNTVIAGHSEYPDGTAAVFHQLDRLHVGAAIFVRDADLERAYIVREILTVDYRDLSVLYPTTTHRLTLITCSIPSYVAAQNLYYERVVVIAEALD